MTDDRLHQLDYYTLLGVDRDADEAAVRKAFRAFARRYHPDRFAKDTADKRDRATAIYRRGSEGLQVLCDPDARELYDRALARGVLRLTADQRDGAGRRKKVEESTEKPKAGIRSVEAKAYYENAVALVRERNPREAWMQLKKALEIEPHSEKLKKALAEVETIIRRA
jgi:curved DNA-binding protein CbpA